MTLWLNFLQEARWIIFPRDWAVGRIVRLCRERTGDGDMDHSTFSTEMPLDIVNSWCSILILLLMLTAWHDKVQVQDHGNITSDNKLWSKIIVYKEIHEIYQPESTRSCYTEDGIKFLSLSKSPCSIIFHTDSIFQRILLPLDLSSWRAVKSLPSSLNNPWTWLKLCSIRWCWMNNGSIVLVEFTCAWPRTINRLWFSSAMQFNKLSIVDWFEYIPPAVVGSKLKPLATLSRRHSRSPDSWPSGSYALASGKMLMSHFLHNLG